MPSAAALVSSCRKSRSLCSKEVFFVKLCKSGGLLLPSPRSLVIPWPTPPAHSFTEDGHVPAEVKKFIVSPVEWKLQFGLVRLRINPRRCEAWCKLDEVTREKLSNTWQRSDRTSVGRFCDRLEVKPNRKFDSVRGLVHRNFRTVRPRFSIQFSISSPVIVRNRRIEPKFGFLNLSINLIRSVLRSPVTPFDRSKTKNANCFEERNVFGNRKCELSALREGRN